jgi:mitogen-activated protein kinase 1/3
MTEYVVTRYYRAPEIMLSSQQYTKAVDIWYAILLYLRSLGCTFAELMTGKVLFKGANYIQMIKLIFDILGVPDEKELAEFINNENA